MTLAVDLKTDKIIGQVVWNFGTIAHLTTAGSPLRILTKDGYRDVRCGEVRLERVR